MRVTHDHLRRFSGGTVVFSAQGRVLSATIDYVELEGSVGCNRSLRVQLTATRVRDDCGNAVVVHTRVWDYQLAGHSLRGLDDSVGVVEVSWASTLALRAVLIPPGLEHLEEQVFDLWRPIAA